MIPIYIYIEAAIFDLMFVGQFSMPPGPAGPVRAAANGCGTGLVDVSCQTRHGKSQTKLEKFGIVTSWEG